MIFVLSQKQQQKRLPYVLPNFAIFGKNFDTKVMSALAGSRCCAIANDDQPSYRLIELQLDTLTFIQLAYDNESHTIRSHKNLPAGRCSAAIRPEETRGPRPVWDEVLCGTGQQKSDPE